MGEIKHHKGRKPDWCFSNPEPPNRRRSVYCLLSDRLRSASIMPLTQLVLYVYYCLKLFLPPLPAAAVQGRTAAYSKCFITLLYYGIMADCISLHGPILPRSFCHVKAIYTVFPRSVSSNSKVCGVRLAMVCRFKSSGRSGGVSSTSQTRTAPS